MEILLFILRVLIALSLYAFLGVILFYQRRDLRTITRMVEEAPVAQLIRLDDGVEADSHPLRLVNLVGRAADNTIAIEDNTLSAHHCRLSHHGGQWWLEDLGSRNGTMVNDLVVEEPLVVTYGDLISLGRVVLRLEAGSRGETEDNEGSLEGGS